MSCLIFVISNRRHEPRVKSAPTTRTLDFFPHRKPTLGLPEFSGDRVGGHYSILSSSITSAEPLSMCSAHLKYERFHDTIVTTTSAS